MKSFSSTFCLFLVIAATSLFNNLCASAQSPSNLIPPDSRSDASNALSSILNGLVIFGSSSAIGSGTFNFNSSDSPDTKLDVIRLFNDFKLTEAENVYIPFITFGVSTAKLTDEIPPTEGGGENDFSTIATDSVGLGMGIDIKLSDNWTLSSILDFIYSHSESHYDYNNKFSQKFLQKFDGDLFNWDVDTTSYDPAIKIDYNHDLGCNATISPSIKYSQIFIDGFSTNSDLIDVSTSSGVVNSRLRTEVDDFLYIGRQSLTFVSQASRTEILGDTRDGLGIKYFHEVALGFLAKNQTSIPIFKDVGLTSGYTFGDDMSGWRIGIDANL